MSPRLLALLSAVVALSQSTTALSSADALALGHQLLARQAEASCHRDCGNTIIQSQGGGTEYCTDVSFVEQLNRCLACADTLPEGYMGGIMAATEPCGFDATPGSSVSVPAATGTPTSTDTMPSGTGTAAVAEVTNCHTHGDQDALYCSDEMDNEWEVTSELAEGDEPESLMDCQAGSSENMLQCNAANGTAIELTRADEVDETHGNDAATSTTSGTTGATSTTQTAEATSTPAAEESTPANSATRMSQNLVPSSLLAAIAWLVL